MTSKMDKLTMWKKCTREGAPIEYAFGPEWVAMAMYMDDMGYATEEEAVVEWYFKIFKPRDKGYYVPTLQDHEVEEWMRMHPYNEAQAILEWYNNIFKKVWYENEIKECEAAENNSADEQPVSGVCPGSSAEAEEGEES